LARAVLTRADREGLLLAVSSAATFLMARLFASSLRGIFGFFRNAAVAVFAFAAASNFAAATRCASVSAFLIASLIEGANATGMAATSFAFDKPPTPSQGASGGNSIRRDMVLDSSSQFSALLPVMIRT
jgi:hypothetical protein